MGSDVQDIEDSANYNTFNPINYNPGDFYWDILALDVYSDGFTNLNFYNNLTQIVGSKLFAIGRCGNTSIG